MPITNVYVDGFNLYYGCLKGTPYKWLDLRRLVSLLLPGQTIQRIRYYTARIRPLPGNPDAPIRQQVYLRALATIPGLTISYGHFLSSEATMPLAKPVPGGPKFAVVIKTEEKGSDVNLAADLLLDAVKHDCDSALVISNDSDLLGPIKIARREFGLKVGVACAARRKPSVVLTKEADFLRKIRSGALQASQFPGVLTDAKGTFSKPTTW